MSEKIKVKAAQGLLVPLSQSNHEFIDDRLWVEVPNQVYYRRRIQEGDLIAKEVKDKKGGKDGE